MADFGMLLAVVDEIEGTKGLQRYRERSAHLSADSLTSDSFIAELMARNYSCTEATAREIHAAIRVTQNDDKPGQRPSDWPKNARAVTTRLTRHAPALRAHGWAIDNDAGHNIRNVLQWTITPPEKGGISDSSDSWSDSSDPADGKPLTSDDELTSQTSHEYLRSQVGEKKLCACGNELIHPDSIRRGTCTRCFLLERRTGGGV